MANLIKITFDPNYDYGFAVGGDIDNVYLPNAPYDSNYKAQGYEKYFVCNGSLFFGYKEGSKTVYDALGIEVIENINNQSIYTDTITKYNKDMSLVVMKNDGKLLFVKQEDIIYKADSGQVYCGFTGIGLLKDGKEYGYTTFTSQYNALSGRVIIGTDKDGNFLSYSIKGETGKSGLTGKQALQVAKDNGFYNAIMCDGGGSVYVYYDGKTLINTTRKIKNTFIIYRKKKADDYKKLYEEEKKKNELLSSKITKIKEIVLQ